MYRWTELIPVVIRLAKNFIMKGNHWASQSSIGLFQNRRTEQSWFHITTLRFLRVLYLIHTIDLALSSQIVEGNEWNNPLPNYSFAFTQIFITSFMIKTPLYRSVKITNSVSIPAQTVESPLHSATIVWNFYFTFYIKSVKIMIKIYV